MLRKKREREQWAIIAHEKILFSDESGVCTGEKPNRKNCDAHLLCFYGNQIYSRSLTYWYTYVW